MNMLCLFEDRNLLFLGGACLFDSLLHVFWSLGKRHRYDTKTRNCRKLTLIDQRIDTCDITGVFQEILTRDGGPLSLEISPCDEPQEPARSSVCKNFVAFGFELEHFTEEIGAAFDPSNGRLA
jgi:hypothetical protein